MLRRSMVCVALLGVSGCSCEESWSGTGGGAGGVGGGGVVCAPLCEEQLEGSPSETVYQGRCAAAFPMFAAASDVVVRQCPSGIVPEGCASLSEYSEGVAVICDGQSLDVLCCLK